MIPDNDGQNVKRNGRRSPQSLQRDENNNQYAFQRRKNTNDERNEVDQMSEDHDENQEEDDDQPTYNQDDHNYENNNNNDIDGDVDMLDESQNDKQDEEKLIKDAVSTLRKVQCRLCKGEHWTTKCPYKDNLQPFMDQSNEKPSENQTASVSSSTTQGQNVSSGTGGEPSSNKWVSVSARRGGAGTAYPGDRGSTRGGSYSGRGSDMRKQDEATVRVTNLPEETQEQDLRDLFTPFGPVSRVFLAKDKTNNTSKGFAFITFNEKKDAQKAIECVSGFGYDHLILKVEWANKPQNQ
jgi:translation initiation factor 3 subunit G